MTVALIVAAGSGERLGAGGPKALVELCGRPLVQWSIDALSQVADIERIVLALPPGVPAPNGVTRVDGGTTRSDSVRRALAAAGDGRDEEQGEGEGEGEGELESEREGERDRETDLVLVHDGARPLVTPALAQAVIAALARDARADAAIAAAPVTDTVKRVDHRGTVLETLDRSELCAVQTPQVFRREALERALEVPAEELARATDDAWLIERAGGRVIVVRASDENLKVTTPLDLRVAELLLADRCGSGGRGARPSGARGARPSGARGARPDPA
jgi:2-C-methyl-D-erythritol 4-phosphate cytidylyltransferase